MYGGAVDYTPIDVCAEIKLDHIIILQSASMCQRVCVRVGVHICEYVCMEAQG